MSKVLETNAEFYGVPKATVRVLASRPLRIYDSGWGSELFGDYDPEKSGQIIEDFLVSCEARKIRTLAGCKQRLS